MYATARPRTAGQDGEETKTFEPLGGHDKSKTTGARRNVEPVAFFSLARRTKKYLFEEFGFFKYVLCTMGRYIAQSL